MRLLRALTNCLAILGVVFGLVFGPLALIEYALAGDPAPVDLTEEHRSDELPVETLHPTPERAESTSAQRARVSSIGGSQTGLGPRAGFTLALLRPPNA